MKNSVPVAAVLIASLAAMPVALAQEAEFLRSLAGSWSGGGPVRMTTGSSPVNVSCEIEGDATDTMLSLEGTCTGLLVFQRRIAAELKADGASYSGSYVGSPRGTATLAGDRNGRTLDLDLQWPGHPVATMELDSPTPDRMVLTTIEQDRKTGERVVTAKLELKRD